MALVAASWLQLVVVAAVVAVVAVFAAAAAAVAAAKRFALLVQSVLLAAAKIDLLAYFLVVTRCVAVQTLVTCPVLAALEARLLRLAALLV